MDNIKLSDFPTTAPKGLTKAKAKKETDKMAREIADLQHLLYAEGKQSLLVVFQGMDSSGKDGATRNVFNYCSPSGVSAYAFKKPTDLEFAHDFLWRINQVTPAKGQIQIFNRSHYEDVLIQRVHKWIDEKTVDRRFKAINAFEQNLVHDNNTTILKFYMHISKKRQAEKLQERIDDPKKNWKHNPGDWEERKYWDDYMFCYEEVLNRSKIPWFIVPVDSRWYRDYIIAKAILHVMEDLKMRLPVLSADDRKIPR